MTPQTVIASRIARELRAGMLVNLGIGIPTLVANYVPAGVQVFFQSENGLIGTGAIPEEGMAHPMLAAPAVRAAVTEPAAEALRAIHSNRLRFAMFSDRNPAMQPVKALAEAVRAARQPVSKDNPLLAMEQMMSSWITSYLETLGEYRDVMTEAAFLNTYGLPLLQALVGLGTQQAGRQGIERDVVREADTARLRADLESRFGAGGPI